MDKNDLTRFFVEPQLAAQLQQQAYLNRQRAELMQQMGLAILTEEAKKEFPGYSSPLLLKCAGCGYEQAPYMQPCPYCQGLKRL